MMLCDKRRSVEVNVTRFMRRTHWVTSLFDLAFCSDVVPSLGPWLSLRTKSQSLVLALALSLEPLLTSLAFCGEPFAELVRVEVIAKLHFHAPRRLTRDTYICSCYKL